MKEDILEQRMDLQQPPQRMPKLKPIDPEKMDKEIEQLRAKWAEFLFGAEPPSLGKNDQRPALNTIYYPDQYSRSPEIERFHLTYNVEPGTTVRAYLLRPRKYEKKLPGVVLFHQTDPDTIKVAGALYPDSKKRHQEIMAADLAQRGYVVLCPECFIYGGRAAGDNTDRSPLWIDKTRKMQGQHPGWKGLGRMLWDGIRAVDVLEERDDVDRDRIGAIGHSLGAKEVLFVAAFDKRVKASVFSDGGIWLEVSNWNSEWYLGQEIYDPQFTRENHEVLAMIAPRAFLLVGGQYDNVRAWPFIKVSIPLWNKLECPRNIGWFQHKKGHCWPPEAQAIGFAFLSQYL